MHTPVKAAFADSLRLVALTALPLLGVLALAGSAAAQPQPQPSPFGPQPPPGGAQPVPGAQPSPFGPQPQPSPFGPQPAPGAPGAQPPGAPGAPGAAPGAPGAPGVPGAPGGDQSSFNLGQNPEGQPPPAADQTPPPGAMSEDEERALSLMEQPNFFGSTGLLRSSYAGSSAAGIFRVGFLTDWFTASSFLCRPTEIAYQ